jgi:hypothetical protein
MNNSEKTKTIDIIDNKVDILINKVDNKLDKMSKDIIDIQEKLNYIVREHRKIDEELKIKLNNQSWFWK